MISLIMLGAITIAIALVAIIGQKIIETIIQINQCANEIEKNLKWLKAHRKKDSNEI